MASFRPPRAVISLVPEASSAHPLLQPSFSLICKKPATIARGLCRCLPAQATVAGPGSDSRAPASSASAKCSLIFWAVLSPTTSASCSRVANLTPWTDPKASSSSRARVLPDPLDQVQLGSQRTLRAEGPVVGDGEPVRLVPDPLEQLEPGGGLGEQERLRSPGTKTSSSRLASPMIGCPVAPSSASTLDGARELPLPAVHDDQVGQAPCSSTRRR